MKKQERQQLLKRLLTSREIERQEDFVRLLSEDGIHVTQATISRDIKEMQLVKLPAESGGYRYSLPVQKKIDTQKKLQRTLQNAYISFAVQDQFTILKVLPGNGPVIASLLDQMRYEFVFGTVGDDSSVLTICVSHQGALQLEKTIDHMLAD